MAKKKLNWEKCYNIKCKYAGKGIHNGYCHGDVCKLMEEKFKRGEEDE